MTKSWPMSAMLNSPALQPWQKIELTNFQLGVSEHTLQACKNLSRHMQGIDITLLYSEGASFRRVFLRQPTPEHWHSLERCMFVDTGYSFGLNVDALH